MIKIAIVEDDETDFNLLRDCIVRFGKEKGYEFAVEHFCTAAAFLGGYRAQFSLLFLDIQLPEQNGLDVAKEIRKTDELTPLIFVTNMAQYAVSGYEVNAVDFIVKPVEYYNFYMRMNKAMRIVNRNLAAQTAIITAKEKQLIPSSQLIYAEVANHDLLLHCTGDTYKMRMQLKEIEAQVPPSLFFKCNVCYLVNLAYVAYYAEGFVYLKNGEALAVSRARKKDFVKALASYIGGSK